MAFELFLISEIVEKMLPGHPLSTARLHIFFVSGARMSIGSGGRYLNSSGLAYGEIGGAFNA
jgi:hypothetical protein